MNISKARGLLALAATERDRVTRHLLVAACLREALRTEPVVVGGLAEDYYAEDHYNPTDLDMCAPLERADRDTLSELGFEREGRHWYHEAARVAVEFPAASIDGDMSRTKLITMGDGAARIIGVDDLYLDRVRQATMTERETDISFVGAVAIAAARFEEMDWRYIRARIGAIKASEPHVGKAMEGLHRRARRAALAAIRPE